MNQYFVLENGKVSEPLGLDELQGKVASGEITEEHLISINGDWVVARDICDLFPEIECEVVERKSELSKETTAINDSKTIQNDRNHIRKINYSPIKGHWHSYSFQIMIISSFILSRRGILLSKGEPFTVAIAIIAIISSLTFIILYLYILYQLWNKVNNLDNTRWPNPSLVTGINIGIIILYMLEFPDLILTISIMGMMLAHLLLGQRIKKVLAWRTTALMVADSNNAIYIC